MASAAVGVGPSTPVGAPIPPLFFPPLALILLVSAGVMSMRFAGQLHSEKKGSSIAADVTLGVVASCLAGLGTLFLLAWVGLYV
jgi:hypothetical protein